MLFVLRKAVNLQVHNCTSEIRLRCWRVIKHNLYVGIWKCLRLPYKNNSRFSQHDAYESDNEPPKYQWYYRTVFLIVPLLFLHDSFSTKKYPPIRIHVDGSWVLHFNPAQPRLLHIFKYILYVRAHFFTILFLPFPSISGKRRDKKAFYGNKGNKTSWWPSMFHKLVSKSTAGAFLSLLS